MGWGDLGFFKYTQLSFFPVAFAFSALTASGLNNMMIFSNVSVYDFQVIIVSVLVFVLLIFILPLIVFLPLLSAVKKKGYMEYSRQAWLVARQYEKELKDFTEYGENKPDASWHVDLIGSFEKTKTMSVVLFDKTTLMAFVLAVILPFLPVIAQQIPLKEIFENVISKLI